MKKLDIRDIVIPLDSWLGSVLDIRERLWEPVRGSKLAARGVRLFLFDDYRWAGRVMLNEFNKSI